MCLGSWVKKDLIGLPDLIPVIKTAEKKRKGVSSDDEVEIVEKED
jgi:hypothetical protein